MKTKIRKSKTKNKVTLLIPFEGKEFQELQHLKTTLNRNTLTGALRMAVKLLPLKLEQLAKLQKDYEMKSMLLQKQTDLLQDLQTTTQLLFEPLKKKK